METTAEVFNALVAELQTLYGPQEAESIARLLFAEKLNITRLGLSVKKKQEVSLKDKETINKATARLLKGEPIQYITGSVHFSGCLIRVNKNALIPRPETEELVQLIINEMKPKSEPFILDIGTGSGCIAISLAKHLPGSHITAIDNSQKALELAQFNALANQVTIDFQNIDILDEAAWKRIGNFNTIVSNPPYIPESEKANMHQNVLNHEPHAALFVPDNEPLIFYQKIAALAHKKLVKGGNLYFEINEAMGQQVKKLLKQLLFNDIAIIKDLHWKDRFVKAVKGG